MALWWIRLIVIDATHLLPRTRSPSNPVATLSDCRTFFPYRDLTYFLPHFSGSMLLVLYLSTRQYIQIFLFPYLHLGGPNIGLAGPSKWFPWINAAVLIRQASSATPVSLFTNKMQPASGIGMSVPRAMKQCFPLDIEDPSRSCLSFLAYSIYQSGMDFASYLGAWDFVLTVMFQNQYS